MNHGDWGKHLGPALLLAVLAIFSLTGAVRAQTIRDLPPPPPVPTPKPTPIPTPVPPKDEDFEVIKTTSNLVMVPVSVVDVNGQPVHGLQRTDFQLNEEGKLQEIAEIGNPEQVPLNIAILFDISSSVSQKGFFEFQQRAAASFLRQVMKPSDTAAIFGIGDSPKLIQELSPAATAAAKITSIPAATTPVPTAFYDTVVAAAKYLGEKSADRHRKVIIVISDGDDNFSNLIKDLSIAEARASQRGDMTPAAARESLEARRRRAVLDVQRAVQQADVAFYSVNPGGPSVHLNQISMRSQNNMQAIADSTGGSAFLPVSEKDLERVFNEMAAELRGQYLLLYYSNSPGGGTGFRRIAVGTPGRPDLRIRAKQGYYPKAK